MNGNLVALFSFAMVAGGLIWWFRRAMRVAIPRNRALFVAWMTIGGGLAVVGLVQSSGWLAASLGGFGVLAAAFVLATVAISRQKTSGAIEVGDAIPAFQATDERGETFSSAALSGGPVLLKFFRGHW